MANAITGVAAQFTGLRKFLGSFEKKAIAAVADAVKLAAETAFQNTPVWQGETVRNYRLGVDGKVPAGSLSAIGNFPSPGEKTSEKPLGSEDGRGANEGAARKEIYEAIDYRRLRSYKLVNTVEPAKWDLIDNGSAPTPAKARNPGGVSRLVQQAVKSTGYFR